MSFLESKDKGKIPVGVVSDGAPGFGVIVPGTDGHVLTVDSTSPTGWKTASAAPDPRDVFRFSMIHNVGVTGGG